MQYKYKLDMVGPSDGSRTPAMADKLHCVVMIDHFGVGVTFLSYNRHSAVEDRIKCPNMIVWKCSNAIRVFRLDSLSVRCLF